MKNKTLGRIVLSMAMMASATAPAMALDYEAKPIMWLLQAPFRTAGALTGAAVSGGVSGPIDDGYHWFLKGTQHVAGKFGDEEGAGQIAAAVPIGGSTGMVLGGAHGVYRGFFHGFKKGWEKPFSRWSYITMEEK
ncbi:MAG: hypothetical protein R3C24_08940 [Cyanobacteriota/Melainabacteria group bacterium]|nr:hypothetical protein [Cyanobacteria bacterium HKST-UBA01]MCB9470366.1 hypothetical protein [Candidatus Obscuribacterales bacterium]